MRARLKRILPALLLLAGVIAAWALLQTPARVPATPPEESPPTVKTVTVKPRPVQMTIHSQGTVQPIQKIELTAEVSGQVTQVASNFQVGGFFEAGERLVQIDPRDYELAITQAKARVAEARSRLLQEKGKVKWSRKGWEMLGQGQPTPLTLGLPELEEARAELQAAKAALEKAKLRRKRTAVRAPFDSLIRKKWVGLGEYVEKGTRIARIIAVAAVEVRLPVTLAELAFLDLPLAPRHALTQGPKVILKSMLAGQHCRWVGRIVRTEGVIDKQTRRLYLIAKVKALYDSLDKPAACPLPVGLFVQATISGQVVESVSVLPRQALRLGETVWVVNDTGQLTFRPIEVLRAKGDWMAVQGELRPGEAVAVSPLPQAVEGMKVQAKPVSRRLWAETFKG